MNLPIPSGGTSPAAPPMYPDLARLPHAVSEKLGYYVYLYIDPRTDLPFYAGKGQGSRILDHLFEVGQARKHRIIDELRTAGLEPRLEDLTHALADEEGRALRVEAAVIDLHRPGPPRQPLMSGMAECA